MLRARCLYLQCNTPGQVECLTYRGDRFYEVVELPMLRARCLHLQCNMPGQAECLTYGGDCFDEVVELQTEQDTRLPRVIEPQDHNTHLHLWSDVHPVVLSMQRREGMTEV